MKAFNFFLFIITETEHFQQNIMNFKYFINEDIHGMQQALSDGTLKLEPEADGELSIVAEIEPVSWEIISRHMFYR